MSNCLVLRTVRLKSGEMEKLQFSKLPTKSTVLKYLYHKNVGMTAQKALKKATCSRMKREAVLHWNIYEWPNSWIKVDWTCAKIQKIKEFLGRSRKQIHEARVNRYAPVQPVQLLTKLIWPHCSLRGCILLLNVLLFHLSGISVIWWKVVTKNIALYFIYSKTELLK